MKLTNIKTDGHIWATGVNWDGQQIFTFFKADKDDSYLINQGYLYIAPYTIEIELPEGIDLHKAKLESLQNKRKLILAENQQRINKIDEEIQSHLSIEDKSNE